MNKIMFYEIPIKGLLPLINKVINFNYKVCEYIISIYKKSIIVNKQLNNNDWLIIEITNFEYIISLKKYGERKRELLYYYIKEKDNNINNKVLNTILNIKSIENEFYFYEVVKKLTLK